MAIPMWHEAIKERDAALAEVATLKAGPQEGMGRLNARMILERFDTYAERIHLSDEDIAYIEGLIREAAGVPQATEER